MPIRIRKDIKKIVDVAFPGKCNHPACSAVAEWVITYQNGERRWVCEQHRWR